MHLEFEEKILQLYKLKFDRISSGIRLFMEGKSKNLLVDRDKEPRSDELRKLIFIANQATAFETMREFMENIVAEQQMVCAILCQCAEQIETTEDQSFKKEREEFVQHLSEYFFENIWQEDRREYSANSVQFLNILTLKRDNRLLAQKPQQVKILVKNLLLGLFKKLVNKNYIRKILLEIDLNLIEEPLLFIEKIKQLLMDTLDKMPFT